MLIKQALNIILSEDAGIAALTEHVFPSRLPQKDEYPSLMWRRSRRRSEHRLNDSTGEFLVTDWFQFFSMALGPNGVYVAEDIDDALFQLLHNKSYLVANDDSPAETLRIEGMFLEDLDEGFRDDLQRHEVMSLYRVEFIRRDRS